MIGVSALKHCAAAIFFIATLTAASFASGEPNCTCRYKGQSYALDSCVCLSTSDGPRMACCGMVLNNTSWKFTKQHCPVVERASPAPTQSFAVWQDRTQTSDRLLRR